ncbi:DEDD exonuclease domain-containing protein [Parenemella sanctibonifatiensis]|uniref:Endonuclease n=1 Tax=Parenemella sanctibonifatiensis TaxID=2016505 RepID=A0A255EFB8_9ACTN|nr:DEDD exonuclease domain-containing protein [Parenemella sanctibonifatiensis]OYN89641.1 endonuclease [Parenemella sanctibonifatiensis]
MPATAPYSWPTSQPTLAETGQFLPEVTFCVVDLETTGAGADAEITEFGAVKVRGGQRLGEFQTLVRPSAGIPALITALTGISNSMVMQAPPLATVLPSWLEFSRGATLVAHNARFDVGFLKRACADAGEPWPGNPVLDTVALARSILGREVRNHKLATLAAHLGATTTPDHRALTDARATVEVLHALIERVGNLGVHTLEDLQEFSRQVSVTRRVRRRWAQDLPERPGVYWFWRTNPDSPGGREVLYVGTSRNLRRRVGSYFTAAERRRRMEEMIRVAEGVDHVVCPTPLEAQVREIRLIHAHRPRYNRRSTRPEKASWLRRTQEPWPRLSVVRTLRDDGSSHLGPLRSRTEAAACLDLLHDTFPIRRCTTRLAASKASPSCALAELDRCVAPCTMQVEPSAYAELVAAVESAWQCDPEPVRARVMDRLRRLAEQERYEEAAALRNQLETFAAVLRRHHRTTALTRLPQLVAARWQASDHGRTRPGWQLHVIRHGRLVGSGFAGVGTDPLDLVSDLLAVAEPVPAPKLEGELTASLDEVLCVADWLEQPGVRLIEVDGDWSWPLRIGHAQPDTANPGSRLSRA